VEYEVVRDAYDNCITVRNLLNDLASMQRYLCDSLARSENHTRVRARFFLKNNVPTGLHEAYGLQAWTVDTITVAVAGILKRS
jgi:hypothetical protein